MPFVSCWTLVNCMTEGPEGKQVPSKRQCGKVVSCNMLTVKGGDTKTWKGTCEGCGTIYRAIITSLPEPDSTHSIGTRKPGE